MVKKYIQTKNLSSRVNLICNEEHCAKTANIYRALHLCKDHEIAVILDGDDWFSHRDVLIYLNEVYSTKNIWLTYGAYQEFPSNKKDFCRNITKSMIAKNNFRKGILITSALRSFYVWLFKNIKLEDFFYQGKFMRAAGDVAKMYPMFEMAGARFWRNNHVLYIYNRLTPISDNKVNLATQQAVNAFVLKKKKYSPLKKPGIKKRLINQVDTLDYENARELTGEAKKNLSSYIFLQRAENKQYRSQKYLISLAQLLEQTKAVAYFLSIHKSDFKEHHTYEKFEKNIYVWQFGYGPKLTQDMCNEVILNKDVLRSFILHPHKICSYNKLGIFGEEKYSEISS